MKKGRSKNERSEKGLSPVIATVLLVTIVVVIALIVFLWIRGMTEEAITKFGDTGEPLNVQLVCDQVSFEASYTGSTLYITNPGNVPIFGMNVKVVGEGSHQTLDLRDEGLYGWPEVGLNQGGVFSDEDFQDSLSADVTEMVLTPVLLGESESGRKTYVCDEGQYGVSLSV